MFDRRSVKLMFGKYHAEFFLSLFSRFRSLAWICNIVCALLLLFTMLVFAYLPISQLYRACLEAVLRYYFSLVYMILMPFVP